MRATIRHSPRVCLSNTRGASPEPKDVFSRALFPNARGALVSEGVLHVGAMGVALCRVGGNPALSSGSVPGSICQPSNLAWRDVHEDHLQNARAMTHTSASTDFAKPGLAVCCDGPLVEVVDI